ncbi:hypothetical protein Droror1_Dr00025720 [Drosera rotundifolia]
MGGCSSCAIGFINTLCLLLSIPFLLAGHLMKLAAGSPCDPVVYKPLLLIGILLFVISCLGILGSCCGCRIFLWAYLFLISVMIIAVLFTIVFGASIMKGKPGVEVQGTAYKEYSLTDFSSWMSKFVDNQHWVDVRSCMIMHDACGKFYAVRFIVDIATLNQTKLTPIESGCCKPPTHCGFVPQNSTNWKNPGEGISSQDPDCKLWSNNGDELCYNCGSCKAGYLAIFLKYWRKIQAFNIVLLIILTFVFVIGCCVLL